MESLWPRSVKMAVNAPIEILKEQVDCFNVQMKGALSCRLIRESKPDCIFDRSYDYVLSVNISSPALPGFKLRLVEVKYLVAKIYPCEICNCVEDKYPLTVYEAKNAGEFRSVLKTIFNSQEVNNALQNLLAQGN